MRRIHHLWRWWMVAVCLFATACGGDPSAANSRTDRDASAANSRTDRDASAAFRSVSEVVVKPAADSTVPDLVLVQGFRLEVGPDGSSWRTGDEASHELYYQPLDEVLDGWQFKNRDERVAVELVSSDGRVLESHPVYFMDMCVDPGGCFTEWLTVFEHPPDYAAYRFVDGSRVVYEKRRSPNPPEVSFLGLEQGQVFVSDADFVFQLLIDDADGDALRRRLLISVDGGPYDSTYQGAFTENGLWDLTVEDYGSPITMTSGVNVPGVARIVPAGSQSVRLLVVLSDGSRVVAAQSPEIALERIAAAPPLLEINEVQDDGFVGPGRSLKIWASVRQPVLFGDELANLDTSHPGMGAEQSVRWTSDVDGDITEHVTPSAGRGRIEADALTPGTHELTATFVADSGLRASDSVTITILGPDDPVAAVDDHVEVSLDQSLEHPVTDNDVETSRRIDMETLEIVEEPKLGTATVLDVPYGMVERVIHYKPHSFKLDEGNRLKDSLRYQICDQGPDPQCAAAQVHITIRPRGYDLQRGW